MEITDLDASTGHLSNANEKAGERALTGFHLHRVLVRPERFELPTAWFVARYSIQLSYGRIRNGILPEMAYARQSFRLSCKKAIACPEH